MKGTIVFLLFMILSGNSNLNAQTMKQALLIIDIQNDYFEGGANPLVGSLEASLNAQKVLKAFRADSQLVVHIQHLSMRSGSAFFIPNTRGAEIHANVAPANHEKVIVKNYPNSFRDTELLDFLKSNNITELVVCGMMTHMCVDATVRAAKDFGFNCTTISDACATKNMEIQGEAVTANHVQAAFLSALNYYYSAIQKTNEYLLKSHEM